MDDFIVSARKYRPKNFSDVVGQSAVTTVLLNAVTSKKVAHAYLFCGPRGVGKTTCARILAKAVNCLNNTDVGDPCNECENCKSITKDVSLNMHELDAASNNSVENIRSLTEKIQYHSGIGTYSVYIMDEVHMLSTQAFNAFLKTLEEPPKHAIFVLATTEKHKIPATIISRCQVFNFKRINELDIAKHLSEIGKKEKINFEDDALRLVASSADGALRDALTLFDQVVASSSDKVDYSQAVTVLNALHYSFFIKTAESIFENDPAKAVSIFNDIIENGHDIHQFVLGLIKHIRNLILEASNGGEMVHFQGEIKKKIKEQGTKTSPKKLVTLMNILSSCESKLKETINPSLWVEVHLIKMCSLFSLDQQETLPEKSSEKKKNPVTNEEKALPPPPKKENIVETKISPTSKIASAYPASLKQEKSKTEEKKYVSKFVKIQKKETTGLKEEVKPLVSKEEETRNIISQEEMETLWKELYESTDTSLPIQDLKTAVLQIKENEFIISFLNDFQVEACRSCITDFVNKHNSSSKISFIPDVTILVDKSRAKVIDNTPRKQFKDMVAKDENLKKLIDVFDLKLI